MADPRERAIRDQARNVNQILTHTHKDSLEATIGSDAISLTHLSDQLFTTTIQDKPLLLTKRDLLQYYAQVSPVLLPHLQDRPIAIKRYPNGLAGESLIERQLVDLPDFLETIEMFNDGDGKNQSYLLCNSVASLLWLVNHQTIEFYPWFSRINAHGTTLPSIFINSTGTLELSVVNYPDFMVFDLDTSLPHNQMEEGMLNLSSDTNRFAFDQARTAALLLHQLLSRYNLQSYVKTSGKNGLHVFVPLVRKYSFEQVRQFAKLIGTQLTQEYDSLITMEWQVLKRQGKIFLDASQNSRSKSLVSAYSVRPTQQISISIPISWSQLETVFPQDFTVANYIQLEPPAIASMPTAAAITSSGEIIEAPMASVLPKSPNSKQITNLGHGPLLLPKISDLFLFKDPWRDIYKHLQTLPLELIQ